MNKFHIILVCCVGQLAVFNIAAIGQQTYFVNQNANGNETGSDWANAFVELQPAISVAGAGDQIWVATGLFTPDPGGSNRAKRFELSSGVKLFGGFSGIETSPSQRDLTNGNTTVLSGNIGNPNDSTDNSFTVLYLDYPDTSTLVDGFVIQHGFAKSDTSTNFSGPTLCGGGVFVQSAYGFGYATFKNCTFRDNFALGNGGGVCIQGKNTLGNTPLFHDCQFINNRTGRHGGGLFWEGGNDWDRGKEFYRTTFLGNKATGTVSFQAAGCARMFKTFGKDTIDFNQCTAINNVGNAYCGCFSVEANDNPFLGIEIDSSFFFNNFRPGTTSITDFYIFHYTNSPSIPVSWHQTIKNSYFSNTISGNTLIGQDIGSLYNKIDSSSASISYRNSFVKCLQGTIRLIYLSNKNSYFRSNKYINCQKVLYAQDENYSYFENCSVGIGVLFDTSIINNQCVKCKVGIGSYSNSASKAQFLNSAYYKCSFSKASQSVWPASVRIENNIFYKDTLGNPMVSLPFPDNPAAVNTFVFNNNLVEIPIDTLNKYAPGGGGNLLNLDPMFIDVDSNNLRLSPCSPLLNAGRNDLWTNIPNPTDFDGNPRIRDGQVDIGPFESGPITQAEIAKIMAACGIGPTGAVKFFMENGCPPYQFNWANSTNTGTDTTGLNPDSYIFTITDSKGKMDTTVITINGSNPQVVITGDQYVCVDATDAMLTAVVSGAVAPVSAQWNTGVTDLFLDNIGAGEYIYKATDANGCTGLDTAYIEEALPTIAQFTVNDASGIDKADGSIILSLISGLPPFKFLWSNGDTTGNPINLLPGNYDLTITNAIGCEEVYSFLVDYTMATGTSEAHFPASLHPNPASNLVFLRWGLFDRFELFDAAGKRLIYRERNGPKSTIGVGGLPEGVYPFFFSQKTGKNLHGKLVVVH